MQNERMSSLEALLDTFDLFPIRAREKKPRDRGWRKIQYTPAQLREWVLAGGNIGIRLTATTLVIDWDPRNDVMGNALDRFATDAGLDLSLCPTVVTPSGGLHVFVALPPGITIRKRLKAYPGLDMKTDGGYVLGIGSIHPNHQDGPLYQLRIGSAPFENGPIVLPEAGLALLLVPERTKTSGDPDMSVPQMKTLLAALNPDAYEDWIEVGMSISTVTGGSDEGLAIWTEWSLRKPRPDTAEACATHWETFDPSRSGGVGAGTLRHRYEEATGDSAPPDVEALRDLFDPPAPRLPDQPPPPAPPDVPEGEMIPYKRVKRGMNRGQIITCLENAILGIRSLRLDMALDTWEDQIIVRGDLGWIQQRYPAFDREWTDKSIAAVREILISRDKLDVSKDHIQDAAITLAAQNAFNPLADWLRSLTWDETPRLDGWLTRYAGVVDSEYTRAVARRILVAAVARVLSPGVKFDCMLVLEGGQGVGKSRLVKAVGGPYADTGLATNDLRSKDAVDSIRTSWIIEMDEMEVLRRTDIQILKGFLSRSSDKARLAYRRNVEKFPRRCVLIGTTNESEYLQDSTGARRFWPVRVKPVTPDGWLDVDGFEAAREQIFAEAVAFWQACPNPESLTLSGEAGRQAVEAQDDRYEEDSFGDRLQALLYSDDEIEGKIWAKKQSVTVHDLLDRALNIRTADQTPNHRKRVGAALHRMGWMRGVERHGGRKVRVWRRPQ